MGKSKISHFKSMSTLDELARLLPALSSKFQLSDIGSSAFLHSTVPVVFPRRFNSDPKLKKWCSHLRVMHYHRHDVQEFVINYALDASYSTKAIAAYVNKYCKDQQRVQKLLEQVTGDARAVAKLGRQERPSPLIQIVEGYYLDDRRPLITDKALFSPVSDLWCKNMCTKLNISFDAKPCRFFSSALKVPKKTQSIQPDGNCFYRAISWIVSGTEEHHGLIRKLVCDFLELNPKLITFGNRNTEEETKATLAQMRRSAVWGNVDSMIAVTHLFQIPFSVFDMDSKPQFSGEWIWYAPVDQLITESGNNFYLILRRRHFEVVLSVKK